MTTGSVTAPAAALPPEPAVDRWAIWSDRCNPILVRELVQAVKGRGFALTVFLALAVSVLIAIAVVRSGGAEARAGLDAFGAGLATLAPLLLFVVPMQAYQSMRLELRAGIVEQLFLSRLRPWRILTGKLLAAMVQFVLYVSVLAPLLATSYLLRGVDLPTIALSLLFALLLCLTATAAAISAAAQGLLPSMQPVASLAIALGLGMATVGVVGYVGTGEYARDVGWLMRSSEFGTTTSLFVLCALLGTTLSGLTAQSFLLHAFENRSTAFRVFLFGTVAILFAWLFVFIDPTHWREAAWGLLFFLVLLGITFGVFMVTEQDQLSPRVRAHVPKSALVALLAAPFLPGRDRGMACVGLYMLVLLGIGALVQPPTVTGFAPYREGVLRMAAMTVVYGLVWLSIAKWLRARLPSTVQGNHIARFLLPAVFVVALLLPVLMDVFVRGGVDEWHVGHVLNPFWTIAVFAWTNHHPAALPWLFGVLALFTVLQVPACVRGVREVLAAQAARRAAAKPVVEGDAAA